MMEIMKLYLHIVIIKKMDKSVLLLKNQNETLKKELKESNQQITYLKNEIEKLLKKKQMNITNYKCNVNIISLFPSLILL